GTADRNRSHWSTSKTPSYTKSVSWQHHRKKAGYRIATIWQCQNTEALQAGERLCLAKGVYQNTSTDVQNTTIAS
ncbi:hypothetical protein SNA63_04135, partial [Escherichia coli]|nr:hypothetical protein [Escherichia coli]